MPRLLAAPNFQKVPRSKSPNSVPLSGPRGWGREAGSDPRPCGWATYVFAVWETFPRLVLWAPKCICMHLSVQRSANGKQKPTPFC